MTGGKSIANRWIRPVAVLAMAAILGAGVFYQFRMRAAKGALQAPPPGLEMSRPAEFTAMAESLLDGRSGFMVWSSNRFGNHDLIKLSLPSGEVTRLTRDAHVDTYPRISPDGGRVVFCRSRSEWVSQRDPDLWDVYVLDLDSGVTTLLAENGFTPSWSEGGESVVFVRFGNRVVEYSLADRSETVLFAAGKDGLPKPLVFQTPEYSHAEKKLAVTLRKAIRANVLLSSPGGMTRLDGGCQLRWMPGGEELYYVKSGRGSANNLWRTDRIGENRRIWFTAPEPFRHLYFPAVCPNSQYLVYGASAEGHEHDTADYEMFLWRIGDPFDRVLRMSWYSGNDCWPDIHLR